jgi:hypothetical protein
MIEITGRGGALYWIYVSVIHKPNDCYPKTNDILGEKNVKKIESIV